MKKFLTLLVAIASITLSGCSKSKSGGGGGPAIDYYVRFKANGTQIEYKASAETIYNKQNGATERITTLGGTKEPFVATKNNLAIALTTVGDNSVNITFTNYATSAASFKKAKLLQFAFLDGNGKSFQSWSDDFISVLPAGTPTNGRLIFTEATSVYLKGNFSATLLSQDYLTRIDITDGEFYVKQR